MKIAIVHEWLVTLGGSELVLRELLRLYPEAHVFTLVDRMPAAERSFLGVTQTTTSFLDAIPAIERHYRKFLPVFPAAVRSLDVSAYDVVISNSHAVAKGVRTHHAQLHVCYCLSPMRYAWDLRDQYLAESGLSNGVRGVAIRAVLGALRQWDLRNSRDVDVFATLSEYIGDRIRRAYNRASTVIYPPVDTDFYTPAASAPEHGASGSGYYITASRFVPYKRVDLIARAFTAMGDRRLIVVGAGPDAAKVAAAAGSNVTLVGHVGRERLRELLRGAKAFLFAADEDFGIAPVEAQACGTPVIAFARGGALETVRGQDAGIPTGVFFHEQSVEAITRAVNDFEALPEPISAEACRANAERFGEERFRAEIKALVADAWARHRAGPPRATDPTPPDPRATASRSPQSQ